MVSSEGTNYGNIVNKYKQEVYTQNQFHNINTNNSTLALVVWAKDLSSELEFLNSLWGLGTE